MPFMEDWIERGDITFSTQMSRFSQAIGQYQSHFGLSNQELDEIRADAAFIAYVSKMSDMADGYKQSWTALKKLARLGRGGTVISGFPEPINPGTPPALVQPNVEKRFRATVRQIKAHKKYTKGIGEALGIEKPEFVLNPNDKRPDFKITLSSGNPMLKWVKGKFDGVEIYVDRGTGFTKLTRDIRSPYIDTHPLPPLGQSAIWKYKMIYIMKDEKVGDWSNEASITVTGRPQ